LLTNCLPMLLKLLDIGRFIFIDSIGILHKKKCYFILCTVIDYKYYNIYDQWYSVLLKYVWTENGNIGSIKILLNQPRRYHAESTVRYSVL